MEGEGEGEGNRIKGMKNKMKGKEADQINIQYNQKRRSGAWDRKRAQGLPFLHTNLVARFLRANGGRQVGLDGIVDVRVQCLKRLACDGKTGQQCMERKITLIMRSNKRTRE